MALVGFRHRNLEKEDIGKGLILGIILFSFWIVFKNHDLKINKMNPSMSSLSEFASIPQMPNKM